jgi:O-antigen biosynthesis protein WbqP
MLYRFFSEIFNRFFALILLIFISPFFVVIIPLVIKLDSGGPVFFRQKRYGYKGKEFKCLKFRTMCIHAPSNLSKEKMAEQAEQMTTSAGKVLRVLGLDELPQLVNILLGDMVFIGPRPVPVSETKVHELRQAKGIYQLKPGLTGWAQIRQDVVKKGFTPAEQVMHDKFYLENQSLWLDIKIIFLTPWLLLSGKHSPRHFNKYFKTEYFKAEKIGLAKAPKSVSGVDVIVYGFLCTCLIILTLWCLLIKEYYISLIALAACLMILAFEYATIKEWWKLKKSR